MSIIVWLKRMFRGRKQEFEVWDTSAISIWTDKFKSQLQSETSTVVVVPEIVFKQLSAGKHKFERARKAYEYILEYTGNKLRFAVVNKESRKLSANEQVISVVEEYYNKGYNVTLVTCNHNQADMAEIKKYKVFLLAGNRKNKPNNDNQKVGNFNMANNKKEVVGNLNEDEKRVKCKKIGKNTYIAMYPGVAVYDNRGKRRIGQNNKVMVSLFERVVLDDVEYMVKDITETRVILKRT